MSAVATALRDEVSSMELSLGDAKLSSDREKDDDYHGVVVVLNRDWRVIECKDGIQWIIQKASPSEWRSKRYLRDKATLIQRVRSLCGPVGHGSMKVLDGLPSWIGRAA